MPTAQDDTDERYSITIKGEIYLLVSQYTSNPPISLVDDLEHLITLHTQKAKWQGHIHAAKSLKRQAELLGGTPEYMLNQFDTHIELSIARLTNPTERSNK